MMHGKHHLTNRLLTVIIAVVRSVVMELRMSMDNIGAPTA